MKLFFLILFVGIVLVIIYFIRLSYLSENVRDIGLVNDQLRPCPSSPNCICSEVGQTQSVAPLSIKQSKHEHIWQQLPQTISELGGEIQQQTDTYLWVTFKTPLFRFVDDVEFRLDAAQNHIHIRSASRVGHSDFGANRKRVELIRRQLEKTLSPSTGY